MKLPAFLLTFIFACPAFAQDMPVAVPVTMKAKLAKDSIEKNDEYYYRINKVKRVLEREEGSKTITEIDRYGNETRSRWWLDGRLFNVTAYTYNEYGDWVASHDTIFGDDGTVESVTLSGRVYEILDAGKTERCVLDTSEEREFEHHTVKNTFKSNTKYEYDSAGNCSRMVTNGYRTYCSGGPQKYLQIISSKYSAKGDEIERNIEETGGCNNGYESHNEYIYSDAGLLITHLSYEDGKLNSKGTYEYDSEGRSTKTTDWDKNGKVEYVFIYSYYDNGLVKRCDSFVFGDKDRDKYTYEYY